MAFMFFAWKSKGSFSYFLSPARAGFLTRVSGASVNNLNLFKISASEDRPRHQRSSYQLRIYSQTFNKISVWVYNSNGAH